MKKFMLFGLMAFALAACSDTNDGTSITCGGYDIAINMAADGESMTAVINGDEMTLVHAISASGARYVGELNDTIVTLWNQGTTWTMFLNDNAPIDCVAK